MNRVGAMGKKPTFTKFAPVTGKPIKPAQRPAKDQTHKESLSQLVQGRSEESKRAEALIFDSSKAEERRKMEEITSLIKNSRQIDEEDDEEDELENYMEQSLMAEA